MVAGPILRLNSISQDHRMLSWITTPTKFPLPLIGNFNIDDKHPILLPVGRVVYASLMPGGALWVLAEIEEEYAPEPGEDYEVGTELTTLDVNLCRGFTDLPNGPGSELVAALAPDGVLVVEDATLDTVVAYITMGSSAFEDVWLRRVPGDDTVGHWSDADLETFLTLTAERSSHN